MAAKTIQFILFNCLFHIINVPFYFFNRYICIPSLVEKGYLNNCHISYSDDLSVIIFFPAIVSLVLTVALNKPKTLFFYVVLHNMFVMYSWFSKDPFDGEFIYTYVTSVSRIVQTLHFLIFSKHSTLWDIINKTYWTVVFSMYIILVYNILKCLIKRILSMRKNSSM